MKSDFEQKRKAASNGRRDGEPPPVKDFYEFGYAADDAAEQAAGSKRNDMTPQIVLSLSQFLSEYEAPEYLIDGLLQRGYCYSLTGMTGAGKTAVALLISVKVANRAGAQKLGPHDIESGRVVYITKENPTDVRMRLIGMASQLNIDLSTLDLFVIREIEDISKDLPRIAREIEAQGPVALVIVDTSPSLFKGDDENSNKQMGDHARNIRKLCDLPGRPVTVALCHPPKHPSSKADLLPRGGGAYLAEVDGNLTLWGHDDRLCDLHWTGKFRGPDFENITFRLTTVITTRLIDKKGRALPTVMAEVATAAEAEETEQQTIFQENRLLTTMLRNPNGSLTDWASDCGWFLRGEVPNKSLVRRVIIRLQKEKLVAKEGRDFTLTKAGKVAAKRAAPEPMEGSKSRHEKRDTI